MPGRSLDHGLHPALIAALFAGLAACASSPDPYLSAPARAHYLPYAGTPVDHFDTVGPVRFEVLSDSQLIAFVDPRYAYLLTIASPCHVHRPPSTNLIWLTSSSVYAGLDPIRVNNWICRVVEIRPIDLIRMRHDAQAARAATTAAAVAPPPPGSPPAAAPASASQH